MISIHGCLLAVLMSVSLLACSQQEGAASQQRREQFEAWNHFVGAVEEQYLLKQASTGQGRVDVDLMVAITNRDAVKVKAVIQHNRRIFENIANDEKALADAFRRGAPLPAALADEDLSIAKAVGADYATSYDELAKAHSAVANTRGDAAAAVQSYSEHLANANTARKKAEEHRRVLLQKYGPQG